MATQQTHSDDAPTDLHNRIVEGTFRGRDDDGYLFELDDHDGDANAVVDPAEFEGEAPWEPGDQLKLLVEQKRRGRWTASARKVEKLDLWDWLEEVRKSQEFVDGTILKENKGGLSVDIGLRAFLPRSHVELHDAGKLADYVGEESKFTVLKFDKKRCNVVVSRRKVLEVQREEQRQETIDSLEEGQVRTGTVRNIVDFGAFVDVGGIDGLLHISNISWGRVNHPSEVLEEGQEIDVEVLEWKPDDERLSLGRKQLLEDPWEAFAREHQVGDLVEGEVVSLADFGAFVEILPGLEGLVHVTELSWTGRNNHPGQVLDKGDEVEVKIIDIDEEKHRVGLSIKQLEPNPWEEAAEQFDTGDVVTGEITGITDFGMFVRVAPDVEGLVHVSDLSWTEEIEDISEHYEEGQEVEVKVLEIDPEGQRLGLGIKQLSEDPWEEAERIAKPGEKIEVEITKLKEFGAFARVVEGVEGLIHISELSERRIDHPREAVRPGQTEEALVLDFNRKRERISLSLTRDQLEEGSSEYTEGEDASTTLGDMFGEQLATQEGADEDDDA
jgi:small subunit ribosomal protein S1